MGKYRKTYKHYLPWHTSGLCVSVCLFLYVFVMNNLFIFIDMNNLYDYVDMSPRIYNFCWLEESLNSTHHNSIFHIIQVRRRCDWAWWSRVTGLSTGQFQRNIRNNICFFFLWLFNKLSIDDCKGLKNLCIFFLFSIFPPFSMCFSWFLV